MANRTKGPGRRGGRPPGVKNKPKPPQDSIVPYAGNRTLWIRADGRCLILPVTIEALWDRLSREANETFQHLRHEAALKAATTKGDAS